MPTDQPRQSEQPRAVRPSTFNLQPSTRPEAVGFLTDTTLCIGCKACEVACKQWNQLPMDNFGLTGFSYDNTGDLGATTWRHVSFVERLDDGTGQRPTSL